ncbi:galectin [Skeletonema marinoi]|uniref:Galectin n=1 Tax=Skeletonema marinoi TaxID=267567 RepID=A0AAD8XY12_9STRA|nr:galectin [Skeletonema marinoi]
MMSATNNNNPAPTQPAIPPTLSHLTPLTKNELLLLSTYDQIKQYEKISAKLKATEAKRRLEEADERYRAKVRERERLENGGDDVGANKKNDREEYSAAQQYNDNDSSDDSEDDAAKQQRIQKQQQRQLEITQLREEIEAKSQKDVERDAAKKREEEMRRELLGPEGKKMKKKRPREEGGDGGVATMAESEHQNDVTTNNDFLQEHDDHHDMDNESSFMPTTSSQPSIISGPSIKKKRLDNPSSSNTNPSTSLIANISGGATPIHDFSTKLKMSKTSLDGSILFPTTIGETPWRPPTNPVNFMDGCFELDLPDFDPNNLSSNSSTNNTVAIKFHAPQESSRFSINIAAPNHNGYDSILFHFNPRQFQRGGQLVINNKNESMWGNDLSVPLSQLPLVFGKQACTLIVQMTEEGFDVFVEGVHCARLEHRMALPKLKGPLCLQFPASDDYGNPEDWEVYRVWWGHKDSMAGKDLSGVAGVNLYSSVHPKKLFVSGLPKIHSDPEVDLRRAEMERAFRKYGGPNGAVFVSVQKDSTFAFVEVASEQQADLALVEMAGRYRVNKARRTKHEALMEERAAKEAAEKGIVKDSVDWD